MLTIRIVDGRCCVVRVVKPSTRKAVSLTKARYQRAGRGAWGMVKCEDRAIRILDEKYSK